MAITKRDGLGRPLTHAEMDQNFQVLQDEQARTATTGSNTFSGSQVITGSVEITGSVTASAFAGDGSSITGVTAEWDGSHVGNANITGSLVVSSHISSSANAFIASDIEFGGLLRNKDARGKTIDLNDSNNYISINEGYDLITAKSGSVVIGAESETTDTKIYATAIDSENPLTSSLWVYGTSQLSGSDYIPSASIHNAKLVALKVTGSIIPEGVGVHDLGSEDNPFQDLYITSESIKLIDPGKAVGQAGRITPFTLDDVVTLRKGKSIKVGDKGFIDGTNALFTSTVSASKVQAGSIFIDEDLGFINYIHLDGSSNAKKNIYNFVPNMQTLDPSLLPDLEIDNFNVYSGRDEVIHVSSSLIPTLTGKYSLGAENMWKNLEVINIGNIHPARKIKVGKLEIVQNVIVNDNHENKDILIQPLAEGNIGIGTSFPPEKLSVGGNIRSSGNIIADGNLTISGSILADDLTVGGDIYLPIDGKIILDDDYDTYLKAQLDDQIEFYAGGNRKLIISNAYTIVENSRLGIGTTSPTKTLTVEGDISASGDIITTGDIDVRSGSFLSQIKIGGTNPHLLIKDETDSGGGGGAAEFLKIGVDETSNDMFIGWDNGDDLHFGTFTEPTDTTLQTRMTIQAAGNVGIGNSTPTAKLVVDGNISASGNIITTGNVTATGHISASGVIETNGSNPYFLAKESNTEFLKMGVEASTGDMMIGWDDSDDLWLGTLSSPGDNSLSAKMIITSDGNVGIGTVSPTFAKLEVMGDISSSGKIMAHGSISASEGISVSANSSFTTISASGDISSSGRIYSDGGEIKVRGNNPYFLAEESSTEFLKMGINYYTADMMIAWDDSDDLHLGTLSNTWDYSIDTKMIIKSTGKVGIGKQTPLSELDVVGTVSASGNVYGAGTGSFGNLTLKAPNGTTWMFSTNNSGHLSLTGSQV